MESLSIRVSLHLYSPSKGLYATNLVPDYHRGVYSYALTTADISDGDYQLLLENTGDAPQNVRISYRVNRMVRAAPLEIGKVVRGKVGLHQMQYFRVVAPADPSKLLTFRLQPETDTSGVSVGDPDLFVCNSHGGLVEISRESATWSSMTSGVEVVHVHPDDPFSKRGRVFIVGIAGMKELNPFSLEVSMGPPPYTLFVSPNSFYELKSNESQYAYFHIDVNPSPGFTYIFIGREKEKIVSSIESRKYPNSNQLICTTEDPHATAISLNLPPLRRENKKSVLAVYISLLDMYPSAYSFTYRVFYIFFVRRPNLLKALSSEDVCVVCFRNQELIHHSNKVYLSIHSSELASHSISCIFEPEEVHSGGLRDDMVILRRVFAEVDGMNLSLSGRKCTGAEDLAFTYSETDALSFISLLRSNIASDAQVFYDLGCGVGDAIPS